MGEQLIERSPSYGLTHSFFYSFIHSSLFSKLLLYASQGARHSLGRRNSLEFRAENRVFIYKEYLFCKSVRCRYREEAMRAQKNVPSIGGGSRRGHLTWINFRACN